MTNRYNALVVVLEHEIREDDAEALLSAIRMIKGVKTVRGHVADMESHIAYERARHDLGQKLLDVVYPDRQK